jgi:molybdenum-dependent DNA-binding transcriptional regulator ModE
MSDLPPIPDFPKLLPQAGENDPWAFTATTGLVDITPDELIDFTPVPRLRRRRNGWTDDNQRLFILALAECGCVSKAARVVGLSARSAYRLLYSDGAESFAEAWDQAIARGVEKLRAEAMTRAFSGEWVPVYRKGRLVRVEHRRKDKLAMALLSGRSASVADNRERASSRRKYRRMLLEKRRQVEEKARRAEEVWAAHQVVLDAIEEENRNPAPSSVRNPPRVRRL